MVPYSLRRQQELFVRVLIYSTSLIPGVSAALPPLYRRDPHDVQFPSFPTPNCLPTFEQRLSVSAAVPAIESFCTIQTGEVSAEAQRPISQSFFTNGAGDIRATLSWDNAGSCPRSHIIISPDRGAGRDCKTILHKIVSECKYCHPDRSFKLSCHQVHWLEGGSIGIVATGI